MSQEPIPPFDESTRMIRNSADRLFEALMDQTADRVYIKDLQSRFVYVSDTLARKHGCADRDALNGLTDFDFFSRENAQRTYEEEQEVLRSGVAIVNRLHEEVWQDGSVTWVTSSKAPLYLDGERPVGLIGISRDVTSEVLSKQQLSESERRLQEKNEILRSDQEGAEDVQKVMIPGRIPELEYMDLGYVWKPMNSVGGDILTFPRNPHDCLLFYLGDVCGHGVQAAFYTVLLKYLSSHSAEEYDFRPNDFLDSINHEVSSQLRGEFVTGIAGHFGVRDSDGGRMLSLSHAGHPFNLHYCRRTGAVKTITMSGAMVMGIPGGKAAATVSVRLEVGDRFYTFTDGILESSNEDEEEFGLDRLIAQIGALSSSPLQEGLEEIYDAVLAFTGQRDQQDDITLLGFELTE